MKYFILLLPLLLAGCIGESTALAPEPSALEQDDVNPSCPGISTVSVTSGPSLTVSWGQASDNYSQTSNITYKIYVRKNTENYDLVSPAKIVVSATSTIITSGISIGNTYTLFVTCSDEKGNETPTGPQNERSIAVADTLPPSPITDLNASNPTYTSALLNWSPSDDGAGGTTATNMRYKVYASTSTPVSTAGSPLQTVISGQTSYLHTGLNPSTTWYYKVVAMDQVGNLSTDSNEDSVTTLADTTPPSFAGNTSTTVISGATTSSIGLSWTAATDNVTASGNLSYRIYRCMGSTTCNPFSGSLVATVTAGATSYTDSGLSSSTVYVYGIRALDFSNNVSTNTDKKITSTSYSSSGSLYAYPTIEEVNIRLGQSVAVANVIGPASGASAFPDLIVGAPNASELGSAYRFTGCVFVFQGTAVGTFSTTPTQVFCQPNATASGTQNGLNFGSAVATGDMDGDSIADIVVSNPLNFRVYIFRTQNTSGTLSIGTTAVPISHPTSNTTFGAGLCIGNSDNVGADDLFIATPSENCNTACSSVTGTGNLLVFNNTSTPGLFVAPTNVSYRISPSNSLQSAGYSLSNTESVVRSCTIGNFDPANPTQTQLVIGSGTVSIAAGVGTDGMVAFYRKTAANTFAYQNVLPTSTPAITGNNWGNSLTRIQLDSGTHELVIGAPNDSNVGSVSGATFIYTVGTATSNFTLTDTGDTFYGGSDFDNNASGSSVAAADIWGHANGKEDLVIGAYLDDGTSTIGANAINLGQVFTYKNTGTSIGYAPQQSNFDTSSKAVKHDRLYGMSLCKGDVNNDGYQDVVVGSPYSDYDSVTMTNSNNVGAVYIYYGLAVGEMDFENPSQIINGPGAQGDGRFGHSCVVMDYNADGFQDLLVGSPYRDVSGNNDRGAVYIYNGASNTALPFFNTATLNSPTATASGLFGYSLAKGDFDNNGFDDLAVGSVGINSGAANSGRVYVYWADDTTHSITSTGMITINPPNGAVGAGTNPHLSNTQAINASLNFGRAMESFRTVTSSTGTDLVICSLLADTGANYHFSGSAASSDIGNCWIYEGKVNGGLAGSYTMMTVPKNEIRYPTGFSTPANSFYFGAGISRGDWNNDGTLDLVICASRQQNLDTNENLAGGCFAYYGLSTGGFSQYNGYNSNAAGTRFTPQPDEFFYNPNAEPSTASRFGEAVLMTDVNNNGSNELIVGEPYSDNPSGSTDLGSDSGRVFIIRGGF